MSKLEKKSVTRPDEKRTFSKGQAEVAETTTATFGQVTFRPGRKWSTCAPLVTTKGCAVSHLSHDVSGRLHVALEYGTTREFGPGNVSVIPPGHDAWVVGYEPAVVVDISVMKDYAKKH